MPAEYIPVKHRYTRQCVDNVKPLIYILEMAPVKKHKPVRQRHYLAEWRKYRNLTQEAAADRMQITQATLSRIERGVYPYNQDFLEAAADAYGADPGSLLMRNPLDKNAPVSIENKLTGIPQEKRRLIEAVVESTIDTMLKTG